MHGIFPTHNNYYRITEIFPHLSKKEIKEVFYPDKKSKSKEAPVKATRPRRTAEDED